MTHPVEVPTLSLPREDMMRYAALFRAGADILRLLREKQGRSAFRDAENTARREAVARANGLQKLQPADEEEWRHAEAQGWVSTERHDSGMTVRTAPLSGNRFGVQAGWEDNHTTTVVGSRLMADDLRAWLRNNSHRGSVDDLRVATEELHEHERSQNEPNDPLLEKAFEWMNQPEQADLHAAWHDKANPDWWGENNFEPGRRRDWLVDKWLTETPEGMEEQRRFREGWDAPGGNWFAGQEWEFGKDSDESLLADRLRGRVPESVLDDPRWKVAEDQFSTLVRQGVDPDLLADSVAGIRFDGSIRSPAGFSAWMMRDVVKRGQAQSGEHKSEEQAKREVAEEWLAEADPDSPLDRARAAQLVGQIDDRFDAQLAERYPRLLDGDRLRDRTSARAERHEANGRDAEAAATRHDAAASEYHPDRPGRGDAADERDHEAEPEPIHGWERSGRESAAAEERAEQFGAAESDRAYAADERDQARQERTAAETAATQPTEAARRADAPLKRPANAPQAKNGLPPRKDPRSRPVTPTQDRVQKRGR